MDPMGTIVIRRALPADAAALAAFAIRTFRESYTGMNREEDMEAYIAEAYGLPQQTDELSRPDMATLIAEDAAEDAEEGSRLAAFAQLRRHEPPPCVTGEAPVELMRFYVDRPWHGRGLAQRLMEEARAAARALGGRTLWLGTWERNSRALAFYKKCGFRDVGSYIFQLGSDPQTDRVLVSGLG
jgi:ribosomal protein S18 acetylase RimI-like enzyme